ncbi:MAG: tRNA-specific adenosine deaminase, partial [Clostridia bacterium]|nr:tRNA-specific adenosine deaminase [Clostridia bacterium]
MGAVLNSRLKRLVFGAYDKKGGACGSLYNLNEGKYNHTVELKSGVLETECGQIIRTYFEEKRRKNKC